jgi:hypothetical protein
MSHTRVKTKYSVMGNYGSTETEVLYCHHNHTADHVTFYATDGDVQSMSFGEWETGNDLWDAMNRLWFPFKDKWGGELKDGVEYYYGDIKKNKNGI